MRARRVGVIVLPLSLIVSASAWAVVVGPTGNPKGIALARAKHRAYAKIGAEKVKETGYVSMYSSEGKVSQFSWEFGTGTVPKGWTRARESVVAALHKNRLVWWRDDLTPPPCTSTGLCSRVPVEVVVNHSGAFYAFGSASSHTCYGVLHGTLPVAVGGLWDVIGGRYSAPVHHGNTIVLVHTYRWSQTQTARSVENVSAKTFLDVGGRVRVSRGGPGEPAFTIHYTDSQLAKAPSAPRVSLCG